MYQIVMCQIVKFLFYSVFLLPCFPSKILNIELCSVFGIDFSQTKHTITLGKVNLTSAIYRINTS